MKYYLAIVDGRKILETRQDHAKKLDPKFTDIEIPTDKAGLQTFAQEALDVEYKLRKELDEISGSASEGPDKEPSEREETSVSTLAASTSPGRPIRPSGVDIAFEASQIEDFVLNRASVRQCENIFGCLGTRFAELVQESNNGSS